MIQLYVASFKKPTTNLIGRELAVKYGVVRQARHLITRLETAQVGGFLLFSKFNINYAFT